MFGRYFDTAELDGLARYITDELTRLMPPAEAASPSQRTRQRLEKFDLELARRVSALASRGGLNFYKKAKLGSIVQEALDGAGYPREVSERFVVDLVSLAAVSSRGAA